MCKWAGRQVRARRLRKHEGESIHGLTGIRSFHALGVGAWEGIGDVEGETPMKAFIAGCLAAIVIAVVAAVILDQVGLSSESAYSTSNVRL